MKKKILAVMLSAAMVCFPAACSSGSDSSDTKTDAGSSEESTDTAVDEAEVTEADFISNDQVILIDSDEFSLVVTGYDADNGILAAELENKAYKGEFYELDFRYVYVNGMAAYACAEDLIFDDMPAAGESEAISIYLYSADYSRTVAEVVGEVTDIQISSAVFAMEEVGSDLYAASDVLASSEDVHIYPDGEENAAVYEMSLSADYSDGCVTIGCNGETTDKGILVYVQNDSDQYVDVWVEAVTINGTSYDGTEDSAGYASGGVSLDQGYAGYITVCAYDNEGNLISAGSLEATIAVYGYDRLAMDEILDDGAYETEELSTFTITLPDCREISAE